MFGLPERPGSSAAEELAVRIVGLQLNQRPGDIAFTH
jgi:hypothetical protein